MPRISCKLLQLAAAARSSPPCFPRLRTSIAPRPHPPAHMLSSTSCPRTRAAARDNGEDFFIVDSGTKLVLVTDCTN